MIDVLGRQGARIALTLLCLCFANSCLLAPAVAQSEVILDVPELPEGTATLPEPGSPELKGADTIGIVINQYNAPSYKKIISPELYMLIRTAGLSVDSARRLKYAWRLDDAWESKSSELHAQNLKINQLGMIDAKFELSAGFPFGSGSNLRSYWLKQLGKESFAAVVLNADQALQLGNMLLWNVQSLQWRFGMSQLEFNWRWVKEGKVTRSASGSIKRVFPSSIDRHNQNEQLYRELIEFKTPLALSAYKWLTFRFRGVDEDSVWVYSPATKKNREVTPSNRSDYLLTSPASADDLWGWSGKIGTYLPVSVEHTIGLVPFPSMEISSLEATADGCFALRQGTGGYDLAAQSIWNLDNRRFPGEAAWAPSAAGFVPRALWKIELASRDPYTLYGRQILYLDTSSQLPVYVIIFDRTGRRSKTIINGFGLAATSDRALKTPYLGFSAVLDHLSETALLIDYPLNRFCAGLIPGSSLEQFTPARLVEAKPPARENSTDQTPAAE